MAHGDSRREESTIATALAYLGMLNTVGQGSNPYWAYSVNPATATVQGTMLAYNGHSSHTQGGGGKSWTHSKKARPYVQGASNIYYDRYKALDNGPAIYQDEASGYVIFTQTVIVTKPGGGG
jgi:hypothetical protein